MSANDAALQTNVVTITDQSNLITSIEYVEDSLVLSPGQPAAPPATVTQNGNVFTITLQAAQQQSSLVASQFNSVCGGQNNEYGAFSFGGTPILVNFFFQVVIKLNVGGTAGSVTAYLAQSNFGSIFFPITNWWIGGSSVSSSGQPQLVCQVSGQLVSLALSGTTQSFSLALLNVRPVSQIKNVFVLMLENHSFDNIFALSGIPNIRAATTEDSNSYNNGNINTTYNVHTPAPASMVTDPGHEFQDVVVQLCGVNQSYPSGGPYPAIDNSGFAANYATTTTEGPAPPPGNIGDIMACFDTPSQLPMIYKLATQFTLCDQWFSSLPGPTWPNRFFVHGASSAGLDHSPTSTQMAYWESTFSDGFIYPNGSIYDALNAAGISFGLYIDTSGPTAGGIPQVSAVHNISYWDVGSLTSFVSALQSSSYPYQYTFIEPNYGDVTNGSYEGGSSQHPMDNVSGGEQLIQTVYEAIRNSSVWNNSLLIITYDEHGGFYDHYAPPAGPPPDDNSPTTYNQWGFTFNQLGVRVPAVIVSPLIGAGVDHTVYDHSSVLATVEAIFGLQPLTQRDNDANNLLQLIKDTPRTDCPISLGRPAPVPVRPPITPAQQLILDQQPLPERGNLGGFLAIMSKTEFEMSGGTEAERAAIKAKVQAIKTRGEARAYIESVIARAEAVRPLHKRR